MTAAGALALAFITLAVPAAVAQMDAFVVALNRCNDPSHPPEDRMRYCTIVINARGIDPIDLAIAYLDLGLAYRAQGGNRQPELDAYSKAITLEPDLWQARVNRAELYLESGDGEHALEDYRALRASGPDKLSLDRPNANIGYHTTKMEGATFNRPNMDSPDREHADYANALDAIGRALQTGYSQRCRARAFAGLELNVALKDCDVALELSATDGSSHHARGIVEFRLANWPAALAEFNTVLSAQPSAAESLYMKGIVERRMGNAKASDTDISAARTMDAHVSDSYAQYGIMP